MNTSDLLRIKLKNDLLSDLQKEYTTNKILNQLPGEQYLKLVTKIINDKCLNESFDLIDLIESEKVKVKVKVKGPVKDRCWARVWKDHRGLRCSNQIKCGDYCLKHTNQITNNGYLSFKRYDEPRPVYNEKGNRIPWYDYLRVEMIDIIINYQNLQVHQLTKTMN